MLRGACGAEEVHTNNSFGLGMWASCANIYIYTVTRNTGNACFLLSLTHTGQSPQSNKTGAAKCWWSFASIPFQYRNGSYINMFHILEGSGGESRFIAWYYDSGDSKYYLRLYDDAVTPNALATSTNGTADLVWRRFKLEFDNDEWTLWSDISGAWQEEFTYSDDTTPDYLFKMDLNFSTDATKVYNNIHIDDCCFWDEDGDNWNSRGPIDTYANAFPRISVAHVPDDDATAGAERDDDTWVALDGGHSSQCDAIDEIPPDAVAKADSDEADYYTEVQLLDDGSLAPEDLTGETIQALLITHVAGDFGAAEDPEMSKFNIVRSGTTYLDSEEGRVMFATTGAGASMWWQTAGYYPWTPANENFTEDIFNACEYGGSLINGETDQITVQAIFFGTGTEDWEWTPEAPPPVTRRIFITHN